MLIAPTDGNELLSAFTPSDPAPRGKESVLNGALRTKMFPRVPRLLNQPRIQGLQSHSGRPSPELSSGSTLKGTGGESPAQPAPVLNTGGWGRPAGVQDQPAPSSFSFSPTSPDRLLLY